MTTVGYNSKKKKKRLLCTDCTLGNKLWFIKIGSFHSEKFEFYMVGSSAEKNETVTVAHAIKGEVTSILLFKVEKGKVPFFRVKQMF